MKVSSRRQYKQALKKLDRLFDDLRKKGGKISKEDDDYLNRLIDAIEKYEDDEEKKLTDNAKDGDPA